ncbi:hypothetical protein V6N13_021795 [Hibiscus sabdariffa]|uniref:Uncharacterized protein n=1 Tax=Hibiscus sabdariffa TaxID=183260 RepID=A0ABR2CPP0_9ROSI
MFAICDIADNIGVKCCLDVYWKFKVVAFTVNNVYQLKNASDVFNNLEFIHTNKNVHIYLVEKADKGVDENVSEGVSKAEEVGENENDTTDKKIDETIEHDVISNVEETNEIVGEELSESEAVGELENDTVEKDANEAAHGAETEKYTNEATVEKDAIPTDTTDVAIEKDNDTIEEDTNEAAHDVATTNDAHDATTSDVNDIYDAVRGEGVFEPRCEADWVEVEHIVEEDIYSNEVGGGNTVAGDAKPEMVEEGESEMNEEEEHEEDANSGFVDIDGDVGEDEVA